MFHRRLGSNTYESSHHQSWFRFCLVNSGFLQGSPGKEKHINQPNHEGLARFSEFLRLEKKQKVPYLFQQGILPKPNARGLFLSLSLSIDNYCPAWQGHIEDSTRTYVWQHNGKVFVQGHTANSNQSWGVFQTNGWTSAPYLDFAPLAFAATGVDFWKVDHPSDDCLFKDRLLGSNGVYLSKVS